MSTATKREPETIPECNGWRNYPTWCVNLWLSNDQDTYEQCREMAQAVAVMRDKELVIAGTIISRDRASVLAERLKDWVHNDLARDLGATFEADLFGWALAHVDWRELAEHYLADVTS